MTFASLRHPPSAQRGLTILEMLVVVTILAAVAGIGALNLTGVIEDKKEQLARVEMLEIAKAIRQFKQDTGYYPKQGPFGLAIAPYNGGVPLNALPSQAGGSDPEKEAWFYSPANFWQLFECPNLTGHAQAWLGCAAGQSQSWDPARGRGWRGPYLNRAGEGLVDLSNDWKATGDVDPTMTPPELSKVPGVADPFTDRGASHIVWRSHAGANPGDRGYLGYIGGPYFAFDMADTTDGLHDPANTADPYDLRPRVVSMGPDGRYGGRHDADPCVPPDGEDDIILCLE